MSSEASRQIRDPSSLTVFDPVAPAYEGWFETPIGRYVEKHEKELLLDAMGAHSNDSILEVGCGTGYFLEQLAGLDTRCVGVEPSSEMIAVAVSRPSFAQYVRGVGDALPFREDSFDRILFMTALEFFQDPRAAMEEAARVLRTGGRLVLGVLNADSSWAKARRRQGGFWHQARFYSEVELESLLTPLGNVKVAACVNVPPSLAQRVPAMSLDMLDRLLGRIRPGKGALLVAVVEARGDE